ncbi:MAG: acyl-CoA thioesterase [Ignavibacteria bacterium GWA2_54_16]|nr:MAG: acyl-CoA thioesterase [Ignavibacteria bacterium GWA2_54_16]
MGKTKTIRESQVHMTEMVLPNHTNRLGNLLGGQLMHWMDICAAIAAFRHTNKVCVTASVDELNFLHPIKEGEVVILLGSVNRTFRTSVEVGVKVTAENLLTGDRKHANTAYLTFVAIDELGNPVEVPPIRPETKDEKRRYADAARRRARRLEHRRKKNG